MYLGNNYAILKHYPIVYHYIRHFITVPTHEKVQNNLFDNLMF